MTTPTTAGSTAVLVPVTPRARHRRGLVAVLLTLALTAALGAGSATADPASATVAGGPGHCC